MKSFNLKILASDRYVYEGPCESVVVPIFDGEYGVMPNHSPMISTIVPGEVKAKIKDNDFLSFVNKHYKKSVNIDKLKDKSGQNFLIVVEEGIITVNNNDVTIAVDSAEFVPEIDINRALRDERLAKEELLKKQSQVEYKLTQASIARALNRIKAKR